MASTNKASVSERPAARMLDLIVGYWVSCGVHVAATPRWPLLSVLPSLTSGPLQYHGRECVPWGIGRCPIGQPAIPALAPCRLAGKPLGRNQGMSHEQPEAASAP